MDGRSGCADISALQQYSIISDFQEAAVIFEVPPPTHLWIEQPGVGEVLLPAEEVLAQISYPKQLTNALRYRHSIKVPTYEQIDGSLRNDYTTAELIDMMAAWYDKTVIFKVDDQCGWGLKVRTGCTIKKDEVIILAGMIEKLDLKNGNCFAYSESEAMISAETQGGTWVLINHAPTQQELTKTYEGDAEALLSRYATANFESLRFYINGKAVAALRCLQDISAG